MTIRLKYLLLFLAVIFWGSCSKDRQTPGYIPNVYVNEQINLTNIQYAPLRQDRGYVYIQGGVRGIIILRESANVYLAFERNCTYHSTDSCATVKMDASNLFFTDPCCGSKFDLQGNVIAGPAAYPLKRYATNLTAGNLLYITN